MKRKYYYIKSVTFLCLMLMLAWSMAGCANTAGFVSQEADVIDAELTEDTAQEPADDAAGSEETSPAADADEPAESMISNDVVTAEVEEISINDIGAVTIGQTENAEAGTGCTVFISKDGMPAGLDVRGGGPASRESELLDPSANHSCARSPA